MTEVINLADYKKKSEPKDESRTPLYVNHATGKITGRAGPEREADFGERLQRIRSSLDKINRLMSSLKEMNRGDV